MSHTPQSPEVRAFFDEDTYTLTYVVWDPHTRDAVVIDPVLHFDPLYWRVSDQPADTIAEFVRDRGLHVRWVLDTHAHADHLTGVAALKERFGAPTAIGRKFTDVQAFFREVYDLGDEVPADGRQFDHLVEDGEILDAGSLQVEGINTPGHTPACMSYRIGDAVFVGDLIFMPDYGTGRCDFPNGSAEAMYDSITGRIYRLPPSTRLFVGHDYLPEGRPLLWETTVGEQMEKNVMIRAGTAKSDFVERRRARDAELDPPRFILQSLQVNINGGRLPLTNERGKAFFKIPANFLGGRR